MNPPFWIWLAAGLGCIGAGYFIHAVLDRVRMSNARTKADILVKEAKNESESIIKDANLQAKDVILKAREEFEAESKATRRELKALSERLDQRENNLQRKVDLVDRKELGIDEKIAAVDRERELLRQKQDELDEVLTAQRQGLQEIGHMSEEQAREILLQRLQEDLKMESETLIRKSQEETKEIAERKARDIITNAIERYAADQVNEVTTCSVHLPSDEMKGRIIGREGRNIRSLESLTGVNILIDETPEVVVISGFDPLRREVARISLERLITDGRIHPARIEEVVAEVQEEIDETIRLAGEEAIYELNIRGVAPELVRTLGRLKYRHSYSQNILKHSIEMAHIMGMMANELGLDVDIAKRAGLFHDLGKALTHEVEGSHALIGADLLKRHGEEAVVINAVAAHHNDVEMESLYAVLVKAADSITAARPGARSETTEIYIKRLQKLEEIATGFRGVEKCYAIQAGREVRVIVEPSKINDEDAMQMARNISHQVEEQLQYPGQIKITVVRETRCVEYAR